MVDSSQSGNFLSNSPEVVSVFQLLSGVEFRSSFRFSQTWTYRGWFEFFSDVDIPESRLLSPQFETPGSASASIHNDGPSVKPIATLGVAVTGS